MPKNSKCVVPYCDHVQQKNKECIYAKFPKQPERCRLWVQAVGQEDLVHLPIEKLNSIRYVCGCHFILDQFRSTSRKMLKDTAVPTLFDPRVTALPDSLLDNFLPVDIVKIPTQAERILLTPNSRTLPRNFKNIRGTNVAIANIPILAENGEQAYREEFCTSTTLPPEEPAIIDKNDHNQMNTASGRSSEIGGTATPRSRGIKRYRRSGIDYRKFVSGKNNPDAIVNIAISIPKELRKECSILFTFFAQKIKDLAPDRVKNIIEK